MVAAMNAMYEHGTSPSAALKTAAQHVTGVLSTYDRADRGRLTVGPTRAGGERRPRRTASA